MKAAIFVSLINFVSSFHGNYLATKAISVHKVASRRTLQDSRLDTKLFATETEPLSEPWWAKLQFWKEMFKFGSEQTGVADQTGRVGRPNNAVLVLGGTGRAGREIVTACLALGRDVVVASRNETKSRDIFGELSSNNPKLFLRNGIDVTDPAALSSDLFTGVSQIACSLGPVFGDERLTSEAVDFKAVVSVVESFKKALQERSPSSESTDSTSNGDTNNVNDAQEEEKRKPLVSFAGAAKEESLSKFVRLDDVIMGGRSTSGWEKIGNFLSALTITAKADLDHSVYYYRGRCSISLFSFSYPYDFNPEDTNLTSFPTVVNAKQFLADKHASMTHDAMEKINTSFH
jgi:hypothetical protein